jgi:hypothetical protein
VTAGASPDDGTSDVSRFRSRSFTLAGSAGRDDRRGPASDLE